jgi:hypothetical protein
MDDTGDAGTDDGDVEHAIGRHLIHGIGLAWRQA